MKPSQCIQGTIPGFACGDCGKRRNCCQYARCPDRDNNRTSWKYKPRFQSITTSSYHAGNGLVVFIKARTEFQMRFLRCFQLWSPQIQHYKRKDTFFVIIILSPCRTSKRSLFKSFLPIFMFSPSYVCVQPTLTSFIFQRSTYVGRGIVISLQSEYFQEFAHCRETYVLWT